MKEVNLNKGITLVALVVTIVVLLILAGVSINLVLGENGLITQAKQAKEKTKTAEAEEKTSIDYASEYINQEMGNILVEKTIDEYPGDITDNNTRDGSVENPYVISSIEDLIAFSSSVTNGNTYEGKVVELEYDLDFNSVNSYAEAYRSDYSKYGYEGNIKEILTSGDGFITIGRQTIVSFTDDLPNSSFKGTFDGKNHKIYNMKIRREANVANTYVIVGMFNNNNGTIKNLMLENVDVNVTLGDEMSKMSSVGGLTGTNFGTIENCSVSGSVVSKCVGFGYNAGALAGANNGLIKNSVNKANVSISTLKLSATRIGGVVGVNETKGTIENSYNVGNVTEPYSENKHNTCIGGVSGLNNGNIKNVYSVGTIKSENAGNGTVKIGGALGSKAKVGVNTGIYYLENSYDKSNVTAFSEETAKTKDEMQSNEFLELLNIDEEIWVKDANNINFGYPILYWQKVS